MAVQELFGMAMGNLRHQGIRTYLTLLGVIIGIAAIVALMSIGAGINQTITDQFESLGTNTIFVTVNTGISGGTSLGTVEGLSENDVKRIRSLSGVKEAIPIYSGTTTIKRGTEQRTVIIMASDNTYGSLFEDTGFWNIGEGRDFEPNDKFSVVVGYSIAKDYFRKEISARNTVEIRDKRFKVIGVTEEAAATPGDPINSNNIVLMPKDGFLEIFPSTQPVFMFVKSQSSEDVDLVAERVERYLEREYGEDKFEVNSSEDLLESVQSVLGVVSLFLAAIAGISLIVGGIGIMNAMLMSVMDRTKEIGTMKAIGATNNTILSLILAESGLVGLLGGLIGIALGLLAAFGVSAVATSMGLDLAASAGIELIAGVLIFAVFVGMASGFYPAWRAAHLDPVEALRYE